MTACNLGIGNLQRAIVPMIDCWLPNRTVTGTWPRARGSVKRLNQILKIAGYDGIVTSTLLYLGVMAAFAMAAMFASSLAHAPRAWHYAMGATAACAVLAVLWTAHLLQSIGRFLTVTVDSTLALVLAALPFGAALIRLLVRRKNTPRHAPVPEDDPVYRRFIEERSRRRRLRRQEEEALENSPETPAAAPPPCPREAEPQPATEPIRRRHLQ